MENEKSQKVSVEWGYETHSIKLTDGQWKRVLAGKAFEMFGEGYHYEGEFFRDYWIFAGGLLGSLRVEYGEGIGAGVGFEGPLSSAEFDPPLPVDYFEKAKQDAKVAKEAERSRLDEKFFERATNLRITIDHIDMTAGLELGDQKAAGFHFEQIYLLLERARKFSLDDWGMLVCDGLVRIDTAGIVVKIQEILSTASRLRQSVNADDPSWVAYSLIENMASLKLLRQKNAHPQIEVAYKTAGDWIFEDIKDFGFDYKMAILAAQKQQKAPIGQRVKNAIGTVFIVGGIFSLFYGWTLYPPILSSAYWAIVGLDGDNTVAEYKDSGVDAAVRFSMRLCEDGACLPRTEWMCGFTVAYTVKFDHFDDFDSVEEAVQDCFSDVLSVASPEMKLDKIRKLCGGYYAVFEPRSTGAQPKDCERRGGNWGVKSTPDVEDTLLLLEAGIK